MFNSSKPNRIEGNRSSKEPSGGCVYESKNQSLALLHHKIDADNGWTI